MANVEEAYTATVTSTDDPDRRGRIKVSCAGLMGGDENEGELPMWVEPELAWGWFVVPDVGEEVEVVILAHSDLDESFGQASLHTAVRWRGQRSWTADTHDTPRPVPEDFTASNYGKRRGFATPQGHVLLFDDTPGEEKVSITWHGGIRDGAPAFSHFAIDEDGSVILSNRNGSILYMNAVQRQVVLIDEHGNNVTMDADGIRLIDNFANIISMEDGVIQIISQGNIVATGADFTAATGSVNLVDGANAHLVRGEDLLIWLNAHTHSTGMGPSGPPIVPATPADFLSDDAMVL